MFVWTSWNPYDFHGFEMVKIHFNIKSHQFGHAWIRMFYPTLHDDDSWEWKSERNCKKRRSLKRRKKCYLSIFFKWLEGWKIRKFPPIPKERVVGIMNNIKPSNIGGWKKKNLFKCSIGKRGWKKKNHWSITKEKVDQL
jgi:hypothetical protein